jgi:hypothetical protein
MPDPLYHTGDQRADALLMPIARSLDTLAERTAQYATRLRMSDGDRELVEMAQRILEIARQDVSDLLQNGSGQTGDAE